MDGPPRELRTAITLARGVVHDLRNLAAIVSNYATVLGYELEDRPDALEDLREIGDAAARIVAMSDALRDFAGRRETIPGALDVVAVLEAARHRFDDVAGDGLTLRLDLPDRVPYASADPQVLVDAICELVRNAATASPDGAEIAIEAHGGPGMVVVAVRDAGCGMAPEVLERACDPFFAGGARPVGGGLGLARVDGMMRECGGRVRLRSTVGEGTVAELHLPLAQEASDSEARAAA